MKLTLTNVSVEHLERILKAVKQDVTEVEIEVTGEANPTASKIPNFGDTVELDYFKQAYIIGVSKDSIQICVEFLSRPVCLLINVLEWNEEFKSWTIKPEFKEGVKALVNSFSTNRNLNVLKRVPCPGVLVQGWNKKGTILSVDRDKETAIIKFDGYTESPIEVKFCDLIPMHNESGWFIREFM